MAANSPAINGNGNMSAKNSSSKPVHQPLPLGWTKIRRVRKRSRSDGGGDRDSANDTLWCCVDPNCSDRASLFADPSPDYACASAPIKSDESIDKGKAGPYTVSLRGVGILLLPDVDSSWFQGHFVPSTSALVVGGKSRPLGLLATNRTDVDDCLKCADGGYREMDLTLYNFGGIGSGSGNGQGQRPRKIKFERAVCTGGDLVRLRAADDAKPGTSSSLGIESSRPASSASFDADRVLTGQKAAPYIRRYFSSVLRRVHNGESSRTSDCKEKSRDDKEVENALPDSAIVLGKMQLTVPSAFVALAAPDNSSRNRGVDFEDENSWMSD